MRTTDMPDIDRTYTLPKENPLGFTYCQILEELAHARPSRVVGVMQRQTQTPLPYTVLRTTTTPDGSLTIEHLYPDTGSCLTNRAHLIHEGGYTHPERGTVELHDEGYTKTPRFALPTAFSLEGHAPINAYTFDVQGRHTGDVLRTVAKKLWEERKNGEEHSLEVYAAGPDSTDRTELKSSANRLSMLVESREDTAFERVIDTVEALAPR